jgi:hypothetical protein
MIPEAVVAIKLAQIATANNFIFLPDRRDQREPTDKAIATTQLIASNGNRTLANDSLLDHARVQVTVTSPVKRTALLAARAIRLHLSGFRGEVTSTQFGTIFVSDCMYAGSRAIYDPPSDGSQSGDYAIAVDFEITTSG